MDLMPIASLKVKDVTEEKARAAGMRLHDAGQSKAVQVDPRTMQVVDGAETVAGAHMLGWSEVLVEFTVPDELKPEREDDRLQEIHAIGLQLDPEDPVGAILRVLRKALPGHP
jgi:hypothetical protein